MLREGVEKARVQGEGREGRRARKRKGEVGKKMDVLRKNVEVGVEKAEEIRKE